MQVLDPSANRTDFEVFSYPGANEYRRTLGNSVFRKTKSFVHSHINIGHRLDVLQKERGLDQNLPERLKEFYARRKVVQPAKLNSKVSVAARAAVRSNSEKLTVRRPGSIGAFIAGVFAGQISWTRDVHLAGAVRRHWVFRRESPCECP